MGAEHCDCQLFREVFTFAPRPLLARGIFAANIGGRLDADELTDIGVFADPRGDGRGIGYSHVKTGRTVDQFVWSDRRAYIDTAGYDDGVGFPGMDGDAGYADIGGFAEDEYPFGRGRVDAPTPATIYLCRQYVRRGSTQPCGNWPGQATSTLDHTDWTGLGSGVVEPRASGMVHGATGGTRRPRSVLRSQCL